MRKLLIVNNNLHLGGVQRALLDLLWSVHGQYDITLLLFAVRGELLAELPEGVRVLEAPPPYRYLGLTRRDAREVPADRAARAALAAAARTLGRERLLRACAPRRKIIAGGYDCAISFLHDAHSRTFYGGCNDFVLNHVYARRKIAYLHCDYALSGADSPANARQYARFDRIAACSGGCRERFLAANPALAGRTLVAHNFHRYELLRARAEAAPVPHLPDRLNVLTVARLGREKGVARALRAIALLGEARRGLHYFVVGDGIERTELERLIPALGLTQTVTLCGALSDPWGRMQAADLLLIPSLHEAAPLVADEAAALGTPVLSTRTCSAEEMIASRGLGWVCENTEDGIAGALRGLLADPGRIREKRAALAGVRFDNAAALDEFRRLLAD